MLKKGELEKIVKKKVNSDDYDGAINVLNKEIKEIFVENIKKINQSFAYTNMTNLANNVERYLHNEQITLFKKYYILQNENVQSLYELDVLVEIYNKLKKGE